MSVQRDGHELANMIGRKKEGVQPGGEGSYQWDDPEYVCLEAGITDEMAEVGLCLGSFQKRRRRRWPR